MTTVSFGFLDVLGQLRHCLKMGWYLLGIKMNFEPRLQVLTGLVILYNEHPHHFYMGLLPQ